MIERIFYGRNGLDAFSIFLLTAALLFVFSKWTWIIALALIAYALFRAFSKDIPKRRAELWKYQNAVLAVGRYFKEHTVGLRKWFALQSLKRRNRATIKYIKCPKCKKVLSLPRGKGKLAVTCTVCSHEFIHRT